MVNEPNDTLKQKRSLWMLAMVNCGIWAVAIIALIFVIQRCSGARGLFPILAGGTAVSISLISVVSRYFQSGSKETP